MVMEKTAIRKRSEIDKKYQWNAESVFAGWEAWEETASELEAMLPKIESFKGSLHESASTLANYLDMYDKGEGLISNLYFYAAMSVNVDSNDKKATAMEGKAGGLYARFGAAASFQNPELIAIGEATLKKWIAEEPRLSMYGQYVHDLFRQQKHVRSAEVEEILGLAGDPMGSVDSIFGQLTSTDMKFAKAKGSDGKEYEVAQSSMDGLLGNADREVRRTAFESYTNTYLDFKNTLAATYLTSVRQDVFNMRVRGFESSMQASLFSNNIPRAVYESLIDTYKKNIPTWHKYWAVRRKALGVDTLQPYDIWAPIAKEQPEVSFEQAVDWIAAGMKPLGDEYVNALRKGCLEDRWVDVFPNEGKRQGAFSYGTHDTFPFIMMSHDGGLGGMSTLAHELGHSLHSYHSRNNQPRVYSEYSLFVAEVASNFNQAMTRAYLREEFKDDANFQIALIEEAMDNLHRYFFIMPTLARFELEVHDRIEKGEGLTADDLNDLMVELFKEGYGDEMHVDPDRVGITWATFGHLYSAFYVYQYATGISAAHALADKVLHDGPDAAKNYVEFLSAGSSIYPLDALNHAGVDMTKSVAVETTFGVLADMVDRLEQLTS